MKQVFLILFCCTLLHVAAQTRSTDYRDGDLLFVQLECGPLCEAIEKVTEGYQGRDFSHIGMVYRIKDSVCVIEAIGEKVQVNYLHTFLSRTKKPALHMRLKTAYRERIPGALDFCLQALGTAYDEAFLYNNGKYYCSELIYDAFCIPFHYEPLFTLESMTFKDPATYELMPAWRTYYEKLGIAVPEGLPGINPGSISRSDKLEPVIP